MALTNMEVADGFFDAVLAGDVEALDALFTPGAVFWQNFAGRDIPKAEFLAIFARLSSAITGLRFEESQRTRTPSGFVEKNTLRGRAPSGADLEMRCCFIATVEDGKIVRLNEYVDSVQLADLRAPAGAA